MKTNQISFAVLSEMILRRRRARTGIRPRRSGSANGGLYGPQAQIAYVEKPSEFYADVTITISTFLTPHRKLRRR